MSSNEPMPSTPVTRGSPSSSTKRSGSALTGTSGQRGPSTPISAVLNESRVTDALHYLAGSDELVASLKSNVARTEYMAKLQESMAYKAIPIGSVEDKKAEAKMQPQAIAAWNAHFEAVTEYEKVRARREREVLVIDVWRSINANRRVGNV
jgi:hypothetical protein